VSYELEHDPYARAEYDTSTDALLDARRIIEDLERRPLVGAADLRDAARRARQLVTASIDAEAAQAAAAPELVACLSDARSTLTLLEELPDALAVTVVRAGDTRFLSRRAHRLLGRCLRELRGIA
jgi:hypothetical protein